MIAGDMVRASGGGPLMKVLSKWDGRAHCVWVDQRGAIHHRDFDMGQLSPFWLATGPRTAWPEITDMPDDPAVKTIGRGKSKSRGPSKRPRASNKIKGRKHAAA